MNEVKNRPGIILISESSYESESSFREGLDEIINDMGYPCLARVVELPYCDPDDDYVDNKTDREEDGTDQQRDIDDWETEWDDDLTNLAREIEEFKASHDRVIIYFSVNTFIIELALAISPSVAYSFISAISGPYTTIFAEQIKVSEKDIEEYFFDILRRRSSQSFRSASPSESQTKTPALFSVDELLETDVYRRKLTEDELRERARSIAKSSIAAVENIYNVLIKSGVKFEIILPLWFVTFKVLENLSVEDDSYLRLYVPDEKYQADQIGSFVRLFESYLNRVEQCQIRVDSLRSGNGTLYVFKSLNNADEELPELAHAIERFDSFMSLCQSDPFTAQELIQRHGLSASQASELITKYVKLHSRLLVDVRHSFEAKQQQLRHAMESEALELRLGNQLHVDPVPPVTVGGTLIPARGMPAMMVNVIGGEEARAVTTAIMHQILNGGIEYTDTERNLIEQIHQHARNDREAISLKSDLDVSKDETAAPEVRRSALQNLEGFVRRNAQTFTDAAFKTVMEYLLKQHGGG